MNKKGGYELADLAGFILIFITTIIFGFILIQFTPEKSIEILDAEHGNYIARETLLKFLDYEMSTEKGNVKIIDMVDYCIENIDKKCWNIFPQFLTKYALIIHKNKKFVSLSTNVDEVRVTLNGEEADKIIKGIKETHDYQSYFVLLNNFNGDKIRIMLELFSENE